MWTKTQTLLGALVALLFGVQCFLTAPFLLPRRYLIAPAWKIVVVDLSGRPLEGAEVEQEWNHWTLETNLGSLFYMWFQRETKSTNKEGIVSFKQRVRWGNRLMELAGEDFNHLTLGIHAGYGPSSFVWARKGCSLGSLVYTPRLGLENTLVLDDRMNTPECR